MIMSSLLMMIASNGIMSNLNPIELLWDMVDLEICIADKSAATVWCYHVNLDQKALLKTIGRTKDEEVQIRGTLQHFDSLNYLLFVAVYKDILH